MSKAKQEDPYKIPLPNFEELSRNMARLVEESGKATAAYIKPIEEQRNSSNNASDVSDVIKTLGQIAETWMSDPQRTIAAQNQLSHSFIDLWSNTLKRMNGEEAEPVASPDARDHRFEDPDWSANPMFDFLKQAYLLTSRWAEDMVEKTEGVDDHTKHKAKFYVKQIASAVSPSNFLVTNPELIRETFKENGANLVRGMKMLAEDVESGKGELKIRQSDPAKFEVGVNLANTPGKVIFRNKLIELIQYSPSTPNVLKRPILLIPPWINKFYVLDLNPEKSFIRWAVSQGATIFCISWVNPDERHASYDFADYMNLGIYASIDAIEHATGENKIAAIGYCVGGTLLSITLAHMKSRNDKRIDSVTLLTTQVDFKLAGDLKVFIDENQISSMEKKMHEKGYLDSSVMANAFNMLRPNDLIWPYVVNVYLKGHSPFPFDLLFWNADSTRMASANHSYYLRNCYLENKLSRGELEIEGVKIDLKTIKVPIFNLAAREDHIAPARSVFSSSKAFGGDVEFVLSGSGHIAGIVNPPSKSKYQYWTNASHNNDLDAWLKKAKENKGSWWPYWFSWLEKQAPARIDSSKRKPGSGDLKPLCDAPGTYVRLS